MYESELINKVEKGKEIKGWNKAMDDVKCTNGINILPKLQSGICYVYDV